MPICPECGSKSFRHKGLGILRCAKCGFEFAEHGVGIRKK